MLIYVPAATFTIAVIVAWSVSIRGPQQFAGRSVTAAVVVGTAALLLTFLRYADLCAKGLSPDPAVALALVVVYAVGFLSILALRRSRQ